MKDTENNEHAELLRAIVRQIEMYSLGKKEYPNVVSTLDIEISRLMDSQTDLQNRLRKEWRVLEEVNALALDEDSLSPLEEHQSIAERALANLTAIANSELDNL